MLWRGLNLSDGIGYHPRGWLKKFGMNHHGRCRGCMHLHCILYPKAECLPLAENSVSPFCRVAQTCDSVARRLPWFGIGRIE